MVTVHSIRWPGSTIRSPNAISHRDNNIITPNTSWKKRPLKQRTVAHFCMQGSSEAGLAPMLFFIPHTMFLHHQVNPLPIFVISTGI
jgi:hypothetical protein